MNPIIRRGLGAAMFLLGTAFSVWLAYNLFIEAQPEFVEATNGDTGSAGKGLILGAALAAIGGGMLFGKTRPPTAPEFAIDATDLLPGHASEVRDLALNGRKIDAIKRYRELTGAGLAQAKQYVDGLLRAA